MDTIERMAANYKKLPHQKEAFAYIEEQLGQEKIQKALELYRAPDDPETGKSLPGEVPYSGVQLIKQFEGCHLNAYPDPLSGGEPITIGWGSTRKRDGSQFRLGEKITQEEADDLLEYQLEQDYLPLLEKIPIWSELNENQRGALISFGYNLGAHFYGANGFETMTRDLKERNWGDIRRAFLLYVNPGSNVEEGLRRRRTAEADLFLSEASYPKPVVSEGINWKDDNAKVSKFFTVGEVTQRDVRRIPRDPKIIKNILDIAKELDKIREEWGGPLVVTSWNRPPKVNREIGGARNSQHLYGGAADIKPLGKDVYDLQSWLDENWYGALGYGAKKGFVHLDIRNGKGWKSGGEKGVRWNY
ncbi:MAG: D-Ala-D-Ala carboxypeptidase family metallohydrolase [Spirulina sp.]